LADQYRGLAVVSEALGKHAEAATAAEAMGKTLPEDLGISRLAAVLLGKCKSMALEDLKLPEADRRAAADSYVRRAIGLLRSAVDKGVLRRPEDLQGRAFQPLEDAPDFRKLREELEARSAQVAG
jgi:hypothetical protein